jgi:hypothetical protein
VERNRSPQIFSFFVFAVLREACLKLSPIMVSFFGCGDWHSQQVLDAQPEDDPQRAHRFAPTDF